MADLRQENRHHCEHVIKKKMKRGKVYEVHCDRDGAQPMFTRPVTSKTRTRRQPRWFCNLHWPKHEQVMFDGVPREQIEFPGIVFHRR